MTTPNTDYSLSRATPADIPHLAAISARAFAHDANTQMKAQGQRPGAFEEGMAAGLRMWIDLPPSRCVVLKAVDRRDGQIVGWICWGICGVEVMLPPPDEGHTKNPGESAVRQSEEPKTKSNSPGHEVEATPQRDEQQAPDLEPEGAARIKEYEKMTSDHLAAFQKKIMSEGRRCLYIIAMAVDPAAQGLGVGSRMVQWGTGHGVLCWVHASEAARRLLEGQDFAEVERLTVDLDEWAVGRRPVSTGVEGKGKEGEEGEDEEGWGSIRFGIWFGRLEAYERGCSMSLLAGL
ncbi:acyl-CoA N-acyltransferase [Apiospora rasikravindrae]|uniref:Acyl-CoA N-acyltransferase n=1 Tax=Apiospora rasikravindrae TaxID=990691 RepID=A0ABR1TCU8_9PEZI